MNIFNIEDFKSVQEIIKQRLGSKFIIAYIDDSGVNTYISREISDMEACYVADTINQLRKDIADKE